MKFLLELVSCCGCQESCGGDSPVPERPSETSSLAPVAPGTYRRRRIGRLGGDDGGGVGRVDDWKPTLCAISEDNVVLERERDKNETERIVKRKSGGFHRDKVPVRSYSKEYGKNTILTFIPVFSPTPFLF